MYELFFSYFEAKKHIILMILLWISSTLSRPAFARFFEVTDEGLKFDVED